MIGKPGKADEKAGAKLTFVDMLIKSGIITREALKSALAEQWERGGTLEEILIEKGFLNEEQLIKFILDNFPMLHYVRLKEIDIDPEAVEHVPVRIAKKYLLIPVRKKGKSLAVAMANPLNKEMLVELKNVTDLKIRPFISTITEIREAIEKYYAEAEEGEKISEPFSSEKIVRDIGVVISKDKTFESFAMDDTNKHAFLLCKDMAETRGVGERKVFLYGPEGSGKTHLMQAIANYILENESLRRVIYIDASKFYTTIKGFKSEHELERYLKLLGDTDILLFDDFDFIAGKDFLEENLFSVLAELDSKGKQIVVSSALPLKDMPTLSRKLRSLLGGFAAIGIEEPSISLKREVIRLIIGEENLPSNVIELLVREQNLNLKKIETIIRELLTYKRLGEKVDDKLLNKVIQAFL